MTVIVGLVDPAGGQVWMGADSASCTGDISEVSLTPKIRARDAYLIGLSGSWRTGQLLHHGVDKDGNGPPDPPVLPEYGGTEQLDGFMVGPFAEWVRSTLERGGSERTDNGAYYAWGNALVAVRGHLYELNSQLGLIRHVYTAIGSGAEHALGSMHTSAELKQPPDQRVMLALRAAAYHTTSVREPFLLLRLRE